MKEITKKVMTWTIFKRVSINLNQYPYIRICHGLQTNDHHQTSNDHHKQASRHRHNANSRHRQNKSHQVSNTIIRKSNNIAN